MTIALIGIGGVFGAIVRYALGKWIAKRAKPGFPLATLIINVTGALFLGLVSGLGAGENSYLLLGEGFLGAYTTFSTFMVEGFHLLKASKRANASVYIAGSLVLGLAGYAVGLQIAGLLSG